MTGFDKIKAAADAVSNRKEVDPQALAQTIVNSISDHIHGPEATVATHVVPIGQVNDAITMAIGSMFVNIMAPMPLPQRMAVCEDLLSKLEHVLACAMVEGL